MLPCCRFLALLLASYSLLVVIMGADVETMFTRLQLAGPDMLIDGYEQYNQRENEVVDISPEDAAEEPAEALPRADDCMKPPPTFLRCPH